MIPGYEVPGAALFREATMDPEQTGFHCYRAVESHRNACASQQDPIPGKDKAWPLFRTTYSVSREDIDALKAFADDVRHGEPTRPGSTRPPITDSQRAGLLQEAWDIVARYVLHEAKKTT